MQYLILICKNLFIKFRKDKFDKFYFKIIFNILF